jgi:hypothetical protein
VVYVLVKKASLEKRLSKTYLTSDNTINVMASSGNKFYFSLLILFCGVSNFCLGADTSAVRMVSTRKGSMWELRNGFFGIVIPQKAAFFPLKDGKALAPIQSLIYSDGTYSDDSPNYLVTETSPVNITLTILKQTVEEVAIRINYSYQKSKYKDNFRDTVNYSDDNGPGFYRTTIILKRGARSALIEEESNYDIYYSIKISIGLDPDKARYRGWTAYTATDGYESDGSAYKGEDARGGYNIDAMVDLSYQRYTSYRRMSLWEVAGGEVNTGRYWQFYDSKATGTANLLGIFQGRASRLYGGNFGGINLVILQEANKKFVAELGMTITRKAPDLTWKSRRRFQWGLFVSSKKDLLPPEKIQPIALELNKVAGLADKIDRYASEKAIIHPSFFYGAIYLPRIKIQQLINKVKTDQATYDKIAGLDPYFKSVLDAWRNPSAANALIKKMIDYGEKLKETFKTGDGSFEFDTRYWKGAMRFQQAALQISCLFADKSISISDLQKEKLLQVIRMMARVVWDDDHVPMFDSAEVNYGNGNMYLQYNNNGRSFFSLLFANDPEFSARAKKVAKVTKKEIQLAIYESGASFSCPHYTQAAIDPILQVMLQLKQAEIADLFLQSTRIRSFADFYSSLLTPPSVRFSGNRKLVSFGDGAEESAVTFALLGSGYHNIDKQLSDRMYYLFENGPRRPGQFGYIAMLLDLANSHVGEYMSGTSNYKGYLSNLRSAINTDNETAVWFLTGDSLIDHRQDDRGEFAIYALKAPLSVSRSSLYYPHANGPAIRNMVIPLKNFPEWNNRSQPISSTGTRTWYNATPIEFVRLGKSISSTAMMKYDKKWLRQVSILIISADHPIIIIKDSIDNNEPNIWSMLFMSQGPIVSTGGALTPVKKKYDNNLLKELPGASVETVLKDGWNKFQFKGQDWSKQLHPSGGIDWDIHTYNKENTSFTVSEWSNYWQNDMERGEYMSIYKKPYEESQQVLRIKGASQFFNIILPYNKGANSFGNVQQDVTGKLKIGYGDNTIVISRSYYYCESASTRYFGSLDTNTEYQHGYSIKGGYAEIENNNKKLIIRVHGNSGIRIIQVPYKVESTIFSEAVSVKTARNQSQVTIIYKSNGQSLLSSEKGYVEYLFNIK